MRAVVTINERTGLVTFKPDTEDDQRTLELFSKQLARPHMITSKGFEYLKADVQFVIAPMPRID